MLSLLYPLSFKQADKLTNEPFSWIAPSGCDVLEVLLAPVPVFIHSM